MALVVGLGACGGEPTQLAPATEPAAEPTAVTQTEPDAKAGPAAAAQGLAEDNQLRLSPDDRCPVCAMRPAEHAKHAAAIVLDDETTFYFCGNGCMTRSWLHPDVYLGVDKGRLARAVVLEYLDGKPVDALAAHWVAGSDVTGPMGPALVPLASEEDVAVFESRHGGRHRYQLGELDDARWKEITGKPAVPEDR
jgi:nitrous oxide reductase accessory protein NosL